MNARSEPTFRNFVDVLRRGFAFAATLTIAAAAVTYFLRNCAQDTYESTVTLHAATDAPNLTTFGVGGASAPPMDLQAYAAAAVIRLVLTIARAGAPRRLQAKYW